MQKREIVIEVDEDIAGEFIEQLEDFISDIYGAEKDKIRILA